MIVEDGATHSQKDSVESNGGSLQAGAEAFTLLLHGAQLVLQSSPHVLKVLDLNEVNVTLKMLRSLGRCYLEKLNLSVDCFGNGLEDISLDVVAVEVWVWELLFNLVH